MPSCRARKYRGKDALGKIVKDYLDGAEADLLRRGQSLLNKIPRNQPREFHLLTQRCRDKLKGCLDALQTLKTLPAAERFRWFQRIVSEIDFLEINGFAALNRFTDDDRYLNALLKAITDEIDYPLLPPVVTSLSHGYFYIWPGLSLMCVPLGEADSLLHLPDLYHELAHPLIDERYEPRIQPFRQGLVHGLAAVYEYISAEQEREQGSRGPQSFKHYLGTWWQSWNKSWLVEFYCDLFATYTLGPAYAWSNLHLCAKRGGDPFEVPRYVATSHPADNARMMVILDALRFAGFVDQSNQIESNWQQLVSTAGYEQQAEYRRCYDPDVLKKLAQISYLAIQKMNCRLATTGTSGTIHVALNDAWQEFWGNPRGYPQWEVVKVQQLRQKLALN